jgi:tetratricopeptide (TPR) repeat protein
MKMRNKVLSLAFAAASFFAAEQAHAQCKEWKWPEDKAKAEESNVLYSDAVKNGHYKQAIAPHQWLLKNAPNLNTSIYIQGAELFDKLADQEKDAAKKQVYVDSLMLMYDMRIQYCGEEASVMNRKAISFYKYNLNGAKAAEVLPLMDKAIELNGNNTSDGLLIPYMQAVRVGATKLKNLNEEQILMRYDKISAIIDAKISKATTEGKPTDKILKYKEDVDAILMTLVKINCDFVRKNLAPKFNTNPSDIVLAKKIFSFMLKDKCIDDPLWLEAGEAIHKVEKSFVLAKNLGLRYSSMDNMEKSEYYLNEAFTLAPTNQDKAEILLAQGTIVGKKGSKSEARKLFRQALELDASNKDAYEKIGDLYYNSFNDCSKRENQADDRAVYLIAYDYFSRAGATQKMGAAKAQFPSKEEIFLVNYQQGQSISVGCWIGESTTVRTRD